MRRTTVAAVCLSAFCALTPEPALGLADTATPTFAVTYAQPSPEKPDLGEFPPAARNALEYVTDEILGPLIVSPVTIRVTAEWVNSTGGPLAIGRTPATFAGFPGALPDTYYPSALADALAGYDLAPGQPDIVIRIFAWNPWYLGSDGNVSDTQIDFVTVALHELIHGLGFVGSMRFEDAEPGLPACGAGFGCWGLDLPDGSGRIPYVFDLAVVTPLGQRLLEMPSPSMELGQALRQEVLFNHPYVREVHDGNAARLWTPDPWQPSESYRHLDLSEFPFPGLNALMRPVVGLGEAVHHPGPVALAILEAMGYQIHNNDCFRNRFRLPGSLGATAADSGYATRQPGEPAHSEDGTIGGKSLWWEWTAPASGEVTIDTGGSGFDTVLAVYTGDGVAFLLPVEKGDVPGGTESITFHAVGGTAYQIAVDGTAGDSGNVDLSWNLTLGTSDLAVHLATAPDPVPVGGEVSFVATITNQGPDDATDVRLFNTLPAGMTYSGSTPPSACVESGGTVSCRIASLANGASATLSLMVRTTTVGSLTNEVHVTAAENEPTAGDNTAQATLVVADSADLSIEMTDFSDPVALGSEISYLIVIHNAGPSLAGGVLLQLTLPAGAHLDSMQPVSSCTGDGPITCHLGSLASGATRALSFAISGASGGSVVTAATVSSPELDPDLQDNSDSEPTTLLVQGLSFVEAERNGTGPDGVNRLAGAIAVAVAPDGKNVYATGFDGHGIVIFSRDAIDGGLTLVQTKNGASPRTVAVSPDGHHVYVGDSAWNLVWSFDRDAQSGSLSLLDVDEDGVNGADGLRGPVSMAVSPDGRNVYIAAFSESALSTFVRDPTTTSSTFGRLTYQGAQRNAVDGVLGLYGVHDVVVSPDGANVYACAWGSTLAMFSRNLQTGALTYLGYLRDGVAGVDGINGATELAISPDGKHVYVTGSLEDAVALFSRNAATGLLTYVTAYRNGFGTIRGLNEPEGIAVSPDGSYVYVVGHSDNSLSAFQRNAVDGKLTFLEWERDNLNGVDGLYAGFEVAVSPSGGNAYVAGKGDSAIAVFSTENIGGEVSVQMLTPGGAGTSYKPGDSVPLQWRSRNIGAADSVVLSMKRDSVPPSETVPDGVNWFRFTESTSNDGFEQASIPPGVFPADDWRFYVRHLASGVYDASDSRFMVLESPPPCSEGGALCFHTTSPCRLVDTRTADQGPALHSDLVRVLTVASACGIPASAKAVSVNITAVGATSQGRLTFYPGDQAPPATSAVNFVTAMPRANNAILSLSGDGAGTLAVLPFVAGGGEVHLILDVNGYFQ